MIDFGNEIKVRIRIIAAGEKAIEELIKVAEEPIISDTAQLEKILEKKGRVEWLAADRLKNAAATKKLAVFDAFEILSRIEAERLYIKDITSGNKTDEGSGGFAEQRAK